MDGTHIPAKSENHVSSMSGAALHRTTRSYISIVVKIAAVAAIGATIAACRPTGDFGRYETSYVYDTFVPAARNVITDIHGNASSEFPLTEDEEELRARSTTLKEYAGPSLERDVDKAAAAFGIDERDYEGDRRVERSTGLSALMAYGDVRTAEQFLAAVALELELLDEYEVVVIRVYVADRSRLQYMRTTEEVPGEVVVDAHTRVAENRRNVTDTILAIDNRIDDYEIEARRIVLEQPDSALDDMVNAIGRLAMRVRKIERRTRELTDPNGIEQTLDLAG